jgi:hypothetical protein
MKKQSTGAGQAAKQAKKKRSAHSLLKAVNKALPGAVIETEGCPRLAALDVMTTLMYTLDACDFVREARIVAALVVAMKDYREDELLEATRKLLHVEIVGPMLVSRYQNYPSNPTFSISE